MCTQDLGEKEGAPWQGGRDGKGQWQWRWQGKGKERASRKGSEGRGRVAVEKKRDPSYLPDAGGNCDHVGLPPVSLQI